jgi:hypothetical protein
MCTYQIPEEKYVPSLSRCYRINPPLTSGSVSAIGIGYAQEQPRHKPRMDRDMDMDISVVLEGGSQVTPAK